jgi:hypothetical protein
MNTNHNKLALRKQTIRTLTAGELNVAHDRPGHRAGEALNARRQQRLTPRFQK